MNKTKVKLNKLVYLYLSTVDIRKALTYEFWYDYIKPKHQDKANSCYMNTDGFIVYIKTKDIFKDVPDNVDNTSNYEVLGPLQKGINKK